jgi:MarR family transcriptional regulator, temperature-dependent positive regulator of motility
MSPYVISQEARYLLLKYLAGHPHATQRELAGTLGMSLGKTNYCVRALMEKGWVKARNFRNSNHKPAYLYILTPKGIQEKIDVTAAFLRRKVAEYDALAKEIAALTIEVEGLSSTAGQDESP